MFTTWIAFDGTDDDDERLWHLGATRSLLRAPAAGAGDAQLRIGEGDVEWIASLPLSHRDF